RPHHGPTAAARQGRNGDNIDYILIPALTAKPAAGVKPTLNGFTTLCRDQYIGGGVLMGAKPERRQQTVAAKPTNEAQPPACEARSAAIGSGVPSGNPVAHDRERHAIRFCGGGPQPSDVFYRRNTTEPSADSDTEKHES